MLKIKKLTKEYLKSGEGKDREKFHLASEKLEQEIRKLQKEIIQIKKEKNMKPDIKIIKTLINEDWTQDRIEVIREKRR